MDKNLLYHDRGMKKWQGLILSEHRESLNQIMTRHSRDYTPPIQMDSDEIEARLRRAFLDKYRVWVAMNEINSAGIYCEVEGYVQGYGSNYVMIDNHSLEIMMIRAVEFLDTAKFWQIEKV